MIYGTSSWPSQLILLQSETCAFKTWGCEPNLYFQKTLTNQNRSRAVKVVNHNVYYIKLGDALQNIFCLVDQNPKSCKTYWV